MTENLTERRVDAGAIRELAERIKNLTASLEHDQEQRQRERQEDRVLISERFSSLEIRQKAVEDLILKYPDGMSHAVAANTAGRLRARTALLVLAAPLAALLLQAVIESIGGK